MKILIVGYGYCGYYLAKHLLDKNHKVTAVSRTYRPDFYLSKLQHVLLDIRCDSHRLSGNYDYLFYCVPPIREGSQDILLDTFLTEINCKFNKIIYFGTSGVYGDHHGRWVSETSDCLATNDRLLRRLDAERCINHYAELNGIVAVILRVAGIYGLGRIPIDKVNRSEPVVRVADAPFVNSIYVEDLAMVATLLAKKVRSAQLFNVSDGVPTPFGSMQRILSVLMGLPYTVEVTLAEALEHASPMLRSFLTSSRKVSNQKLMSYLKDQIKFEDKATILRKLLIQSECRDMSNIEGN